MGRVGGRAGGRTPLAVGPMFQAVGRTAVPVGLSPLKNRVGLSTTFRRCFSPTIPDRSEVIAELPA